MKNTHVVWLDASTEVISKSLAREHVINNGYCCWLFMLTYRRLCTETIFPPVLELWVLFWFLLITIYAADFVNI